MLSRPSAGACPPAYWPADCRDVVYAAHCPAHGTDHHWFPLNDGRWVAISPRHLAQTEGFTVGVHSHGFSISAQARN